MTTPNHTIKVSIMQREFTIACTPEESHDIIEAAAYLDQKMRAVSTGTKVLSLDRCAIMAGLNLSHELLTLRQTATLPPHLTTRIETLHHQITTAVTNLQPPT